MREEKNQNQCEGKYNRRKEVFRKVCRFVDSQENGKMYKDNDRECVKEGIKTNAKGDTKKTKGIV